MQRHKDDKWEEYKGYILPQEGDLSESLQGNLYINGYRFDFRLTRQTSCGVESDAIPESGKRKQYLYRGKLSIKKNGKILRVKVRGEDSVDTAQCSLYLDTGERDTVKEYIIKKAEELAARFANDVYGRSGISPETITPQQAALRYARRFVEDEYTGSKPDAIVNHITKFCSHLEAQPMSLFSTRAIRDCISKNAIGRNRTSWSHKFWSWCLYHQYCTGTDPFPDEAGRKRRSADKLQEEAVRSDGLSPDEQDILYEDLLAAASDYDCGVALMGSGFIYIVVCLLKWKHVIFHPFIYDCVMIATYNDVIASATHELTRPCIPPCARVLRKAYIRLRETHTKEELDELYIVGGTEREKKVSDTVDILLNKLPPEDHLSADAYHSVTNQEYIDADAQMSLWDKKSGTTFLEKSAFDQDAQQLAADHCIKSSLSPSQKQEIVNKARNKVQADIQNELSKAAAYRIRRVKEKLGTLDGYPITASRARKMLLNTYMRNLILRCGLDKDTGTFLFLSGRSLASDVTASNYVSFTAPCAADRLYTILKVLDKERPLLVDTAPATTNDGRLLYTVAPKTTHQNAGAVIHARLQPGKYRFEIVCKHGCKGVIRTHTAHNNEQI